LAFTVADITGFLIGIIVIFFNEAKARAGTLLTGDMGCGLTCLAGLCTFTLANGTKRHKHHPF
jgi:hypothetical protein